MIRASSLPKVAATLSAVALMTIYIYDRAGGEVLPRWGADEEKKTPDRGDSTLISPATPPGEGAMSPAVIYSSKFGRIEIPLPSSISGGEAVRLEPAPNFDLMPGSKSAVIFTPQATTNAVQGKGQASK